MAQGATRKRKPVQPANRLGRVLRAMLGGTLFTLVIGLLGLAVVGLLQLPVERVIVSGDLRYVSREELMSAVSGSLDGGFLWADLQYIRAPLEQLPWVYRVVVKRRWPNSLEVEVKEQRPIAHWGEAAYLNHAGEVFEPERRQPLTDLPRLHGPEGSHREVMQYYTQIQERLQPTGLQVLELNMDPRGGVSVELVGGGRLVVGRGDVEEKLSRFLKVYRADLEGDDRALRSVDLRYSHGVAVAWADSPANNKNRKS